MEKLIHPLSLENWILYIQEYNFFYEFVNHFHNVKLKYAVKIKGFDPNRIFMEHMLSIGFKNPFIHAILSEE
jgi:hypothetical protein